MKHPNYLDKDCRINALNCTAESLKGHGVLVHILHVYSSVQRNNLISSKCSGARTEDIHKVNWPFYEPVMFLNDNFVSRSTKCNTDDAK